MNRAYSILSIKAINEDQRIIEGWATTPEPDREGDIVNPMGAKFALPLPFLMQHDSSPESSVGHVVSAAPSKDGIKVRIQIEKDPLLPELDKAWARIKKGLVRGLSIGFRPTEKATPIKGTTGVMFNAWEWLELSGVVIAANAGASITSIKSFDQKQRAASGHTPQTVAPPGATGNQTKPASSRFFFDPSKGKTMKTIQEQVAERKEGRETDVNRMKELGEIKAKNGSLTEEERTEVHAVKERIQDSDDDIAILESQLVMSRKAKPVSDTEGGRRSAGHIVVRGKDADEKFKGQNFTRMVIAKALSEIDEYRRSPATIAEDRWGKTNPTLVQIIKVNEVPGGGTDSGEWGAELVTVDSRYTGDFIEYLYSMTVFDKLPLRQIPHNVAIKGQDGAATAYWVGQSKAIPATAMDFSSVNLTPLKVAALAVVSNELLRDSSPAAEQLVRDALVEASSQRVDTTFLSAAAAVAGVSPAGILNGIAAGVSSGNDAASIVTDFKTLLANFISAKNIGDLVFVTTPSLAAALGLMRNALGQLEFPGLTVRGGSFLGYNVVVGDNVGAGDLILLNPREIYRIGDLGVQVSISRDAMIEQSTAPTGATDTPVAASQYFTSMFQEESTAIKVVRPINFAKRRATAVAYIGDAAYGSEAS